MEVALRMSKNDNGASLVIALSWFSLTAPIYLVGFHVPEKKAAVFGFASTQFLTVRRVLFFLIYHLQYSPANCSLAQSHSSPLSLSYPLRSWSKVSIGQSECGMYGHLATFCRSLRLTTITAIPYPFARQCIRR